MIEAFETILSELEEKYKTLRDNAEGVTVRALHDGKLLAIKDAKLKLEVFQKAKDFGFEVGTLVAKRNGENFNHGGWWKNVKNIRFNMESLHIVAELDGDESYPIIMLEPVKSKQI